MICYERLLSILKKRGMSESFASEKILGMSRGYLRERRLNNGEISDERLEDLCEVLGTTPDYIKGKTDDPYRKFHRPRGISSELWEQLRGDAKALALLDIMLNATPTQLKTLEAVVDELSDALKDVLKGEEG